MKIVPALSWTLATDPAASIDERLLPLLDAIAHRRSLSAAVADCGISYRAAWGLLRDYQHRIGAVLVDLERGRGASLSPAGERLVEAQRAAERRLARAFSALAVDIGPGARRRARSRPELQTPAMRLRLAASHDFALAALREALPVEADLALEITVMGSLHALRLFDEGGTDLAGFHVPIGLRASDDFAEFRQLLNPKRDRLIRFADREQGFILPHGNAARVHNFADAARKGLRFVNRQPGSGTRVLIDRLLAVDGVDPSRLTGYGVEEFTHAAVGATVASGAADVGFGLRAAAAQYRLAFVPRVRERYYLAARASTLATPAVTRLIDLLRGPAFSRVIRTLAGYRRTDAGKIVGIEALSRGAARAMR
jgi:molybdate transport repressor ModE-like protein